MVNRANDRGRRLAIKDPASLVFGAFVLVALTAGYFFPTSATLQHWAPPCAFRAIFSMPCPTCGATRAFVLLAGGDVFGALWFAPLPTLLAFAGAIMGGWALLTQIGAIKRSADLFIADLLSRPKALALFVVIVVFSWGVSLLRLRAGLDL